MSKSAAKIKAQKRPPSGGGAAPAPGASPGGDTGVAPARGGGRIRRDGASVAALYNRLGAAYEKRMHLRAADQWRARFDATDGLTMARVKALLREGDQGAYSELQWLYHCIEADDPTLGTLVDRRTSAIREMAWSIKTDEGDGVDEGLADEQEAALFELYNGIEGLEDSLAFMGLASFRGFSHLEKIGGGEPGVVTRLVPVEQWHWAREGLYGAWEYVADARGGAVRGEPVDPGDIVVREVARPIDRAGSKIYVRKAQSERDWDGFGNAFGIPPLFIILPEDVPEDQWEDFQSLAEQIVSDARGTLPGGSKVETVHAGSEGKSPYEQRLAYLDSQLILRGTGGLLTMLAKEGSGTLAGNAHAETFRQLAAGEAVDIAAAFRRQIDRAFLEAKFPGRPHLVCFEISHRNQVKSGEVIEEVLKLGQAGFRVAVDQIRERTGYDITEQTAVAGAGGANATGSAAGANAVLPTGGGGDGDKGGDGAEEEIKNRMADVLAKVEAGEASRSEASERLAEILKELLAGRAAASGAPGPSEDERFLASALGRAREAQGRGAPAEVGAALASILSFEGEGFDTAEALRAFADAVPEFLTGGETALSDALADALASAFVNGLGDAEPGDN